MTPEEQNVALLRRLYESWHASKGGSVQDFLDAMDDEVDWRSLAGGVEGLEFARASTTRADVARYFEGLGRDWEMIHYIVDDFIAQGERVVVLSRCSFRHRVTGKVVETDKADVVRIRDGRIVGFYEYFDTAGVAGATRA